MKRTKAGRSSGATAPPDDGLPRMGTTRSTNGTAFEPNAFNATCVIVEAVKHRQRGDQGERDVRERDRAEDVLLVDGVPHVGLGLVRLDLQRRTGLLLDPLDELCGAGDAKRDLVRLWGAQRACGPPPRDWMHWPWLRKPSGRQPPCWQSALLVGGGSPKPPVTNWMHWLWLEKP